MLFLGGMLCLIRTGTAWESTCHAFESHASQAQKLIAEYQTLRIKQAAQRTTDASRCPLACGPCFRRTVRRAPCRRVRGLEGATTRRLQALEENLVYAAMRARFVLREQNPGDAAAEVLKHAPHGGSKAGSITTASAATTAGASLPSPALSPPRRKRRRRRGSAELVFESQAAGEPVVLSMHKDPVYRLKGAAECALAACAFE